MDPLVKWTGSKRYLSTEIIENFPSEIDTFYEPFLGGAHVLSSVIKSNKIKVDQYIGSDISEPLIGIWRMVKSDPNRLYKSYKTHWDKFQEDTDYYYEVREEFNKSKEPELFLFLSRTCYNGLIRFNSDGEFNTSVHFDRPGIEPQSLYKVIINWSRIFEAVDVEFKCQDYSEITPKENDWVYLDPPYYDTKSIYHGGLDLDSFYEWINSLSSGYALSFDGKVGSEDQEVFIPDYLYDEHVLMDSSVSGFRKLKQEPEEVYESLYLNYSNHSRPGNQIQEFFKYE